MVTKDGKIWVTYWPKRVPPHTPEYLGQLYGGKLRPIALPHQPYYFLKLDYSAAPVPVVDGMELATGRVVKLAVLPNGSVVNASQLPASLRGHDAPIVCKQGSRAQPVALYGMLPSGRWQPILTWQAWQIATLGVWRYDSLYPLECSGRFAGYFWVIYESAGTGAIFRVRDRDVAPVGVVRPYLVTDHAMILAEGDELIEAYSP